VVSSVQDELIASAISMYPNPSDGIVNLEMTAAVNSGIAVDVLSADGRLISTRQHILLPGENRIIVDMEELSSGYYFVAVRNEDAVISVQRVIRK
jgi:hypothetical protein